jgi:hypothetical protein
MKHSIGWKINAISKNTSSAIDLTLGVSVETRLRTRRLTSVFPLPLGNSHFEQIEVC